MGDGKQELGEFLGTSTSIWALTVSTQHGDLFEQFLNTKRLETQHCLIFPGTQEEAARAYDIAAIE